MPARATSGSTARPTATPTSSIELLHARGDEPLGRDGLHSCAMDFEGDQWTFFKPPPDDLEPLFGLDIHEMQPYRAAADADRRADRRTGRTIIVELDSWFLPDTAATSYRSEHVKTLDRRRGHRPRRGERLRYFHDAGLYELDGEDYRGVFRLGRPVLRRRAPAVHRARALRRGGRGSTRRRAARRRARAAARASRRAGRRRIRSSASASSCTTTCPACSTATRPTTTPMRSRPCAWPARRSSSPPRTSTGCWRAQAPRARDAARGSSRAARCSRFRLARRRDFDPEPAIATLRRGLGARRSRPLEDASRLSRPARRVTTPRGARRRSRRHRAARGLGGRSTPARRSARTPASSTARAGGRARVPGTAAVGAARRGRVAAGRQPRLRRRGLVVPHALRRRRRRAPGEEVVLVLDGIATVAEVYLNGELVLESDSMFAAHAVDVGALLRGDNELAIRCRALGAAARRCSRRPRARWRTRLVADGSLRFFRTMLLGRAPGFAPGPAARRPLAAGAPRAPARARASTSLRCAPRVDGRRRRARGRARAATARRARRRTRSRRARAGRGTAARGALELASRATGRRGRSGERARRRTSRAGGRTRTASPALLRASRLLRRAAHETLAIDAGRVGFRALAPGARARVEADGLDLHVNGVRGVRPRGASGRRSTRSASRPTASDAARARSSRLRDAGMNMLRIAGHRRLRVGRLPRPLRRARDPRLAGLHVRQPGLPDRRRRLPRGGRARGPARSSRELGGRPSLAVLCGNERGRAAGRDARPRPGARARRAVRRAAAGAGRAKRGSTPIYVPSAPCGGELPFRPDRGVRQLLRRRRLPAPARGRAPRGGPLRRRVPGLRQRARRGGARATRADAPAGSSCTTRAGRPACRATPAAAGTSTTCATTTSALLFGVDPARAAPRRPRALPRALARGERRGDGRGLRRVAPRRLARAAGALVLWLRDLAAGRRLGPRSTTAAAEGRLPPPAPRARAGRGVDDRRGPRRDRRARRQRRPEPLTRAAAGRALPRLRAAASTRRASARAARARRAASATSRRCSATSSTPPGPIASGRRRTTWSW